MRNEKLKFESLKKFLITTIVIVFPIIFAVTLVLLTEKPNQANAAASEYEFIRIKIDSTSGMFNSSQLWNFFGTDDGTVDEFNVTSTDYLGGVCGDCDCGLLLTEEFTIGDDHDMIFWVEKGVVLKKTGSLDANIGSNYITCCSTSTTADCDMDNNGNCQTDVITNPGYIFQKAYGPLDDEECATDNWGFPCNSNPGNCCRLATPPLANKFYIIDNEALCNDAGKWILCNDESTCVTAGGDDWACDWAGGSIWENCTALGQSCIGGDCVIAVVPTLLVSITLGATSIPIGGTTTVDVKVTSSADGSNVLGANVDLAATGGVLVPNNGVTNASGQIPTVTYNAPAAVGTYTITATATNAGFNNGIATVSISVNSCSPTSTIFFQDYRYVIGEQLDLRGTDTANNFTLCLYDPPPLLTLRNDQSFGMNAFPQQLTFTSDRIGTWIGTIELGAVCPGAPGQCRDSTDVVECETNADCLAGETCINYVCVVSAVICNYNSIQDNGETGVDCGGGGCPPCAGACAGKSFCEAALTTAVDTGCLCGTHVVTAAETAASGWCCSAVNWVAVNQPTCQAADPLCAAPPVCDNDGICDPGETNANCTDCPILCNNNGQQDAGETGVDCGGGGCPPCPPVCGNNIKEVGESCDSSASPSGCTAPQICNDDCTSCVLPPLFPGGLVPCGRHTDDPLTNLDESAPCSLCHTLVFVKKALDFALTVIIFPVAGILITVSGGLLIFAGGNPKNIATGKTILLTIAKGVVIAIGGWLLIETVIAGLVPSSAPWRNWKDVVCNVAPCNDNGNCDTVATLDTNGKITTGTGEDAQSCPIDCACNIAEGAGCGGAFKKECNFDGNCEVNETAGSPEPCPDCAVCGDNIRDAGEECDGNDFGAVLNARIALVGGQNCDLLVGYTSGQFICSSNCNLKTNDCEQK